MSKFIVPVDFSDVIVIAFDPTTRPESFVAGVFRTVKQAEQYVSDMKRFEVPYDFTIGDYTYRRKTK